MTPKETAKELFNDIFKESPWFMYQEDIDRSRKEALRICNVIVYNIQKKLCHDGEKFICDDIYNYWQEVSFALNDIANNKEDDLIFY